MSAKGGRAGRFLQLPAFEKWLFLEAFIMHLWVWLLLRVMPFRKIPRMFAAPGSPVPGYRIAGLKQIKEAVRRASVIIPVRNRCLVSSLAARCMLTRRNIKSEISLGVAKTDGGKIRAHAWISSGDYEIVEQMGDYRILYFF